MVSAVGDLAAEDLVTLPAAGDLTTEDLVTENSDAGSAGASDIMDITASIPIPMTATLTRTITTRAIIRDRVRFRRHWLHRVGICRGPPVAPNRPAAMSAIQPLLGGKQTYREHAPTAAFDP